tara:strand:+ start:675 stop:839 length:165 start_codon:yes stop_codon:yes gene_type:complete
LDPKLKNPERNKKKREREENQQDPVKTVQEIEQKDKYGCGTKGNHHRRAKGKAV